MRRAKQTQTRVVMHSDGVTKVSANGKIDFGRFIGEYIYQGMTYGVDLELSESEKMAVTIENLKYVSKELPLFVLENPEVEEEFNMEFFGGFDGYKRQEILSDRFYCKTSGCLLGNIAKIFDLSNPRYYHGKSERFNYGLFKDDIFPGLDNPVDGMNKGTWNFLFSFHWSDWADSFQSAMKRVDYFIAKNGNIGDWKYRFEDY